MIHILYGTDSFFHPQYGDDYYCKSLTSAKKQLLKTIADDLDMKEITIDNYNYIKREFEKWVFDKKTCFGVGVLNISIGDLHILVKEINLI